MSEVLNVSFTLPRVLRGGFAGLAGGLVFGAMMQMMGMIPMVAGLVGSTSVTVGWAVHLAVSAAFGVGLSVATAPVSWFEGAARGFGCGMALWGVVAMLVMRSVMGMPVALDEPAAFSGMGHAAFGVVAGTVLTALHRADASRETRGAQSA